MTLILNQSDWDELLQQVPQSNSDNLIHDEFEELTEVPEWIGQGHCRGMELMPGVWLSLLDRKFHQDWMLKAPVHNHSIQFGIFLSGFLYFDDVYPNLGGTCGYFSGSGISPAYVQKHRGGQRLTIVNVDIEPEWLDSFFLNDWQQYSNTAKLLFKGDDWKMSFYPTVTPAMRSLAQQLWNAPYRGIAKRLYLQGKVFELLAMQLDLIAEENHHPAQQVKRTTIDRIYHAREIVLANLENPPSVMELAQQVEVSASTLQRKFRELFGKTVFGYLTDQRMNLAEQLLRQGNCTVVEIATMVGYSNPAHFAAAFKRRFGITPSECMMGRMIVSR
jgi:AraC-like DNA-binding protein